MRPFCPATARMKQMPPQFVSEARRLQPVLRVFKKEYSTTFMNSATDQTKTAQRKKCLPYAFSFKNK